MGRVRHSETTSFISAPPEAPENLRVESVTASQISIAWDASADDVGIAEYQVSVSPHEGNLLWTGETSAKLVGLAPLTEYTFSVKARDFGYNFSPASLRVSDEDGCGEVELRWTQSTDDQDPQSAIRYRIFINGVPDPVGSTRSGLDGRSPTGWSTARTRSSSGQ